MSTPTETLLSTPFSVSPYQPYAICSGSDGRLWFTTSDVYVGAMTTAGVVSTYSTPALSGQGPIVAGPDGNLWILYGYVGVYTDIAQVDTSGTVLNTWNLTTGLGSLCVGADGNLYGTSPTTNVLVRITMSGVQTALTVTGAVAFGQAICSAADGNLMIPRYVLSSVYEVDLTGTLVATYTASGFDAAGIALGGDGNYWISDDNNVWQMTPSGSFTDFPSSGTHAYYNVVPTGDSIWFTTSTSGDNYAALVSDYSGDLTQVEITDGTLIYPGGYGSCVGPDGNLYFTDSTNDVIWKVGISTGGAQIIMML